MFSYSPPLFTELGGKYYTYNIGVLKLLKKKGLTKLATLTVAGVPSGAIEDNALVAAAAAAGVKSCYENNTLGLTQTSFTPEALAISSAGCNGVSPTLADSGVIAISSELKQAGSNPILFSTSGGYDEAVLGNSAARAALEGGYFAAGFNLVHPNKATKTMLAALKTYDPTYKGGVPSGPETSSYISADLMIRGLEAAGKNPTRSSFISSLRDVSHYTAGGLLPSPIGFGNFATKGMFPKSSCSYIVQLKGDKYMYVNGGKPVCGNVLAFKSS
jgi:ABC-type branched-subunit amino acid transport system substrate-binding protein